MTSGEQAIFEAAIVSGRRRADAHVLIARLNRIVSDMGRAMQRTGFTAAEAAANIRTIGKALRPPNGP